jgi:ABC-2 type transport system permease protein
MTILAKTGRIPALIVKEILTLFRDPKSRVVLIGPPLLQLIIFSFAATLEVKNVSVAILNQDSGRYSSEIIQRLIGSRTFTHLRFVQTQAEFQLLIDNQKVIAAVRIPEEFSRDIEASRTASMQVILDGRRSNAAQIVNGYISQVVAGYDQEIRRLQHASLPATVIVARSWFNENQLYLWFTVPSLVGILAMLIALIITALSVARERELGTFDQLLVSPLMPYEVLIGKTIPAILIGLAEGLLVVGVGVTVLGIPFTGSILTLIFALFVFVMSIAGVGLFISAISKTQQQAILGAFVFMVPAITLSGYAAPAENMPQWLQTVSWINPLKHFLVTVKGLFLKDMSYSEVWVNTWPLIVIGVFTLSLAGWFFTRRLE